MPELGVMAPYADGLIDSGSFLADLGGVLEECGVESIWAVEHVVVAEGYEPLYPYSADGRMPGRRGIVPMPDPLELLSFVAGATRRLRLGTAVVVAPLHSPVVLAKRAATLDLLSEGRLLLGLGIGWQKEEYAAVGVPYAERGQRLDDCIGAMRALWAASPATYEGRYVSFRQLHSLPRPAGGSIPIVLGGNTDGAVSRAGRVADGWFPYTISPEEFEVQGDLLRRSAAEAGRSDGDVTITVWPGSYDPAQAGDPAWVRRYVDAGASRLIAPLWLRAPDLDEVRTQIRRYQDEVLARL